MNKTKWYTRPVYLLVALALVLSLGVAGTVSQPNAQEVSANPGSPSLMVDIVKVIDQYGVEKYPPYNFNVSESFLVNAAIAYKNIDGTGSRSVSATIDPGQYVNLIAGEEPTKGLGSIKSNGVTDVWWWVHCNGEGISTITVTASDGILADASDSITVAQGPGAAETVLVVELIECPSGTTLHKSDNFVIKANVTNVGGIIAEDVWGTISIPEAVNANLSAGNPDNWELGDIWPGESAEVMWNLHCDGLGEGNVTIDATASNLDPTQIQEAYCYVNQGEAPPVSGDFWVTVDAPDKVCQANCEYNNFTVNATVYNWYGENATNVNLTLNISGEANFRDSPADPIHPVGDMVHGQSNTTTWNISCLGEGTATFTVLADGDEPWADDTDMDNTSQKSFLVNITAVTVTDDPSRNITAPVKDKTLDLETCENFTVNATLTNCDCYALENVSAVLDLPSDVELAPGSTVSVTHYNPDGSENWHNDYPANDTISGLTVCQCCYYEIIWNLHCKASSVDQITVTAYDDGVELDNDWFWVNQKEKAHLAAGIEVYPGNYTNPDDPLVTTAVGAVYVCQNFTIVIPVFNLGEAYATNVSVNYTISGNTSCVLNKTLGYTNYTSTIIPLLNGTTAEKILIPCHCAGEEDVTITVNFINGTDEITGKEIIDDNKYLPDPKDIMQIPFEVEIIQPLPGTNFSCSDEFAVKVIINNTSTDPTNDVAGVNATIFWTGPGCAEFVDEANQSYTIPLGDLDVNGTAQEAAWLMHCCGMGDVSFTVTVTAENPIINIVETVSVTQSATTTLNVTILSPEYIEPQETPTYATCEEFAVTAKVVNTGNRPLETVTVTITPGTYAQVVSGSNPVTIAGGLAPGASQIVSWTLHADSAEAACDMVVNNITVQATAPCASTGSDDVSVDVYPAAHLVVSITEAPTEVEVGSDFNVTVTVNNTGWADASQVVLSIDTGANTALTPGEKLTKTIGKLVGFGNSSSAEVTWTLRCKEAGMSTIIITPVGNDECGWHSKQNTTTGEPMWKHLPGMAINPAFLEPDDVTVEQKTIIPGPEVTTIDLYKGWNLNSPMLYIPPANRTPSVFLASVVGNVDIVWGDYDPANGTWKSYDPSAPTNDLNETRDGKGYWINMTAADTLDVSALGTELPAPPQVPPTYDVVEGWNLIGFKSTTSNVAGDYLAAIDGTYTVIYGYDAATGIYFTVGSGDKLQPGYGYWIAITEPGTIYP